jgi:protein-S-isoprenylcysteine O-methyltransferase Ste14
MKFEGRYKYILIAAACGAATGVLLTRSSDVANTLPGLVQPLWVSMALFALFTMYWTKVARNSAPVMSAEHWASTALHQILLNSALLLLFLRIPGLRGRWLPASPWFAPIGVTIQAAATLLAIWARRHLGRNWSAEVSAKVDHQLIRSGPYERLRHPIYTAMLGIYISIAIASGEWHALAGVALLAVAYSRKIRLEEQIMLRVFGADYDAYREDSWALIPWVL